MRKRRGFEAVFAVLLVFSLAFAGYQPPAQAQSSVSGIVDALRDEISDKKGEVDKLKRQMASYERQIEEKRKESATLSNQLSILENRIAKTKLDIEANELQIEATDLEIQELEGEIEDKTLKIINQRETISEFIRALHRTDRRTAIDIFLTEQTLADFFNDVQFLEESQRELKGSLDTVKLLRSDLEDRKGKESAKRRQLEEIQEKLESSKAEISEQQNAQVILVDQVKQSESRYRYLLAQLKREVANINSDIVAIEKKLRKTLDEERLRKLSGGTTGWQWPVDPSRGITAFFHDPDYPFRHVFEHPAIDVRAAQGTPIRAAKGGYVARARNNGYGYSYIMLVHDQGLSTVYGHVSKIFVQADTFVEKGEVIGLSGGAPGTLGAGSLSTGPHLHFEVRSNGIPVNPLNYLKY